MTEFGVAIPEHGLDRQLLLDHMQALRGGDVRWRDHRAFGLVYHHSAEHTELLKEAYGLFFSENGLNPMAFKSLQRMERDVVRMTAKMFHGDEHVVGSMTSGGTESLLLTVLAYRNHARRKRPWVRRPEIIVPESVHAAVMKAGEYFDVKIVKTPVGTDCAADVEAVKGAVSRNTIAIVTSAPSYPYGVIDSIEVLGTFASERGIPLHVDACLGGFLLPWVEKLGYPVQPFDFRVRGVTSISADIHKYGYAAKGASTLLYRSVDYFRDQVFAEVNWCGGVYGGVTMAGTRPGGPIAAAWASLHGLGESGYMANAKVVMEATQGFMDGIRGMPELAILGRPAMSVFSYGARDKSLGMYAVADQLETKGWHVDRLQRPPAIHLIINPGHAKIVEQYLQDLREAIKYVKAHPDTALEGTAPMYGLIAKAPMRKMVKNNVVSMLTGMYAQDAGRQDADGGEHGTDAPGVPKPILTLMRLKSRVQRMFGAAAPKGK